MPSRISFEAWEIVLAGLDAEMRPELRSLHIDHETGSLTAYDWTLFLGVGSLDVIWGGSQNIQKMDNNPSLHLSCLCRFLYRKSTFNST